MEKLIQRRFFDGSRECWLVDQERVRIRTRHWGSSEEVEFPLSVVRDSYDRLQQRPLLWLLLAIFLAGAGAYGLYSGVLIKDPDLITAACCFLAASIGCGVYYNIRSADLLLFRHHDTGKLLFSLWSNQPGNKVVKDFVNHLFDCASAARRTPRMSDEQRLSVYRDYLQYLHNEAVLTYEEASGIYQRARLQLVAKRRAQIQAVE